MDRTEPSSSPGSGSADLPAAPRDPSHSFNARLGLILFTVYCAIYGGFVYLSAFRRDVMERPSIGGVNLAIIYGFALILGAFLLALIYMALCRRERRLDA